MKSCKQCGWKNFEVSNACERCGTEFPRINIYKTKRKSVLSILARGFMLIPNVWNGIGFLFYVFAWLIGMCLLSIFASTDVQRMVTISSWIAIGGLIGIYYKLPFALTTFIMTIKYFRRCQEGNKASIAFGVCTILFVNLLAGIFMLCDRIEIPKVVVKKEEI